MNKIRLRKAAGPSEVAKYRNDDSEWKVWCWSDREALSESA